MIDLSFWPTPNGHKITIRLEEAGLPYTIQPVNIGRGEQGCRCTTARLTRRYVAGRPVSLAKWSARDQIQEQFSALSASLRLAVKE